MTENDENERRDRPDGRQPGSGAVTGFDAFQGWWAQAIRAMDKRVLIGVGLALFIVTIASSLYRPDEPLGPTSAETLINESPAFEHVRALREVDPYATAAFVDAVRAMGGGDSQAARLNVRAQSEAVSEIILLEYGSKASDQAILAFANALVANARQHLDNPRLCYFYTFGAPPGTDPLAGYDVARLRAESDPSILSNALALIVRTAQHRPHPVDRLAATRAREDVMAEMRERYDAGELRLLGQAVPRSEAEYAQACSMFIDMVETKLRHENAVDLLRDDLTSS